MKLSEARKRKAERAHLASVRRQSDRLSMIYRIMDRYDEAYRAVNGVDCKTAYKGGWVYIYVGLALLQKARVKELEKMAETLWAQHHETELGGDDDE